MQQYIDSATVESFRIETVGTGQVDDQSLFTGTQILRTGYRWLRPEIPDFLVKDQSGLKQLFPYSDCQEPNVIDVYYNINIKKKRGKFSSSLLIALRYDNSILVWEWGS
jgi:hypothetical protein